MIVVRGAGDLASGIIHKLHNSGFKVVALETKNPLAIRRKVSFSEAVYDSSVVVDGVSAKLVSSVKEAMENEFVSILIDPNMDYIQELRPDCIIDSIMAKRNVGTKITDARIVIGVGPGFTAGIDCHAVVETKRGHDLGRIYYEGTALQNTGIPGTIKGYDSERVLHSPENGMIKNHFEIGDIVKQGQPVFTVIEEVIAPFTGVLRGIIRNGTIVKRGMKVADLDPRIEEVRNCYRISEKARCIAGSVLEAVMHLRGRDEQ